MSTPAPTPSPSYLGITRTGRELTDLLRTYQRGDLDALTAVVEAKDDSALRALLKAAVVTMSTEGMDRPSLLRRLRWFLS